LTRTGCMKLCRLRVASPCATAVTSSGMERRMDDLQSSNAVEGCAPVQKAHLDPVTQLSHIHRQGHATGKSNAACCNSVERRSALTSKSLCYDQPCHSCNGIKEHATCTIYSTLFQDYNGIAGAQPSNSSFSRTLTIYLHSREPQLGCSFATWMHSMQSSCKFWTSSATQQG